MKKIAFITGISGQDGSYLAEYLLEKNYEVHGLLRHSANPNLININHLIKDNKIILHKGDLLDSSSIFNIINSIRPDEIYNLAAMSHVKTSFQEPIYTAHVNAIGALLILETIKSLKLEKKTRFYQASTSELYGMVYNKVQDENTSFHPYSPYSVAKLYSYWITVNYREAYGIFACNGVLFNHESPRRGEEFVTRKITLGISKMIKGQLDVLKIGNFNTKRDWGHSKDFVKAMHMILNAEEVQDYVVATGVCTSLKEFIEKCFSYLDIKVGFRGTGIDEKCIVTEPNPKYPFKKDQVVIESCQEFYRPSDVNYLLGDSSKIEKELGWKAEIGIDELVSEMMRHDIGEM